MVIVQPSDLISRYCLADEAFQYRRSPFGVRANVTIQRTTIPVIQIVAAAIPGFITRGLVRAGETTVMVLTGSGLKAASTMADIAGDRTRTDQPEAGGSPARPAI